MSPPPGSAADDLPQLQAHQQQAAKVQGGGTRQASDHDANALPGLRMQTQPVDVRGGRPQPRPEHGASYQHAQGEQAPASRGAITPGAQQPPQQQTRIDQRRHPNGQGQPRMSKVRHEQEVQQLGEDQYEDG